MALTPYPSANEQKENPSMLVSDDGTTWTVPDGLTNPIVPEPSAPAYNFDPDIIVDGDTMYLVYGYNDGSDATNEIYIRTSTDGVTWSAATLLFSVAHGACLSPAVVKVGSTYYMYSIFASGGVGRVERRSSSSMTSGWSAAATMFVNTKPYSNLPWHIDMIYSGGKYSAMILTNEGQFLFTDSTDGTIFKPCHILLESNTTTWDARLYRGSIVANGSNFDLWYSAYNGNPQVWNIGRGTINYVP